MGEWEMEVLEGEGGLREEDCRRFSRPWTMRGQFLAPILPWTQLLSVTMQNSCKEPLIRVESYRGNRGENAFSTDPGLISCQIP